MGKGLLIIQQMVRAKINGVAVEAPEGTSILDAARQAGIEIPTLCKHPDLLPTAACGLCIVKVAGEARMPRACTTAFSVPNHLPGSNPDASGAGNRA